MQSLWSFNSRVHGMQPNTNYEVTLFTADQALLKALQLTTGNAGSNDDIDSDGTFDPAARAFTVAVNGTNRDDIDFGLAERFGLGDRLWIDANGNGIQDNDEEGLDAGTDVYR